MMSRRTGLALWLGWLAACSAGPRAPASGAMAGPASSGQGPAGEYLVYVGAESADLLHRVRFGPEGAAVERTVRAGRMETETEGPHGLAMSPDGRHLYMTTGHGVPDGKLWKYHAGPDTLAALEIDLGYFPASVDLSPDGLFAFIANFNLHGEPVPSTVSVVYTPDMVEVARVETCVMPHGSRVHPSGTRHYSVCMMEDQLVEIDAATFEVSRRFSVAEGNEGPLAATAAGAGSTGAMDRASAPTCKPTWAEPSVDGEHVYVACNGASRILEIDVGAWALSRTIRTSRPGPYNLDVSPDGRLLVATLKASDAVEFFDLERGESVGLAASSTTIPHGVVVSPDSRYAFVSVEGVGAEPGKVDIYDLDSYRRVAAVAVGQQASGIAFWRMPR